MKKITLVISSFIFSSYYAQVGINTSSPDVTSVLEINASTKPGGLLVPRVALQSKLDIITIKNPANGLVVYNTNTSIIDPQQVFANYLYTYNGTEWKKFSSRDDLLSSDDLPYVVAVGRKTTQEKCSTYPNPILGKFNLDDLSDPTKMSSSGEFTAPKTGYYSFSVFLQIYRGANALQSFEVSPYVTADGVTTYSFKFRGNTGTDYDHPKSITGSMYLIAGQKTQPFYWSFGSGNPCNTNDLIKDQRVVWEYLGNP